MAAIIAMGRAPSLLELIGQADGVDAQTSATAIQTDFENAGATFVAVSSDPQEAVQFIEIRRLAYPAAERLGRYLIEDVAVPRSKLPTLLESIEQIGSDYNVKIMTVAHVGDGNVHPVFVSDSLPDGSVPEQIWAAADEVFRTALDLGGALTGEHGVGVLKSGWVPLELSENVPAVHKSIKNALDPAGILNPGKGF